MRALNIAHRGARSLAPENTLPAARKGWQFGADCWELDTCLTRDGKLILLHDDTLKRTTNVSQMFPGCKNSRPCEFTLDEIRLLDAGSWFNEEDPFGQIAAGQVNQADQARFIGLAVPTLEEALRLTRAFNWRVNIEIKDHYGLPGDEDVAEKVAALVQSLGMVRSVFISSFNHEYLARIKKALPELSTAALVEEPHPDPVGLLEGLGAAAYNPPLESLTQAAVKEVRSAGYGVNVWTVNLESDMRRLIAWNVSGIFTDFPQRLRAVLAEME